MEKESDRQIKKESQRWGRRVGGDEGRRKAEKGQAGKNRGEGREVEVVRLIRQDGIKREKV